MSYYISDTMSISSDPCVPVGDRRAEEEVKTDRREFLKGVALAAGAGVAAGCASALRSGMRAAEPKWVDLQVNGRVGVGFTSSKLTEEGVLKVVEALRDGGTDAFLPTVVTSSDDTMIHAIRTIRSAMKRYPECERRILGLHLEGPFISDVPGYSGAHNKRWTRDCDFAVFERWQDAADGLVRLVTIDGDRKGAEDFARRVTAAGAVVSLGHTTTWKTEDLDRLARAGAKAVTHLGNALPNELPRHHNLIWTALANPHYTAMFIADGFHLPKEMLHAYVRVAPLDRLVTVSDCSPWGGLPPGRYESGGHVSVLEPSGFLRSPATNSLDGSSCLMADCMKVLMSPEVGLSYEDCLKIGRENPLKLIGLS